MPPDRDPIGPEFKRRADARAAEITQLSDRDKMRVDNIRQDAEVQKDRIRITQDRLRDEKDRLRDEKERKARDLALGGSSPRETGRPGERSSARWKPMPGRGMSLEEAEAAAKRTIEEQDRRDHRDQPAAESPAAEGAGAHGSAEAGEAAGSGRDPVR